MEANRALLVRFVVVMKSEVLKKKLWLTTLDMRTVLKRLITLDAFVMKSIHKIMKKKVKSPTKHWRHLFFQK